MMIKLLLLPISIYYTQQCLRCVFTAIKETISLSLLPVVPGLLIIGDLKSAHYVNELLYVGKVGVFHQIEESAKAAAEAFHSTRVTSPATFNSVASTRTWHRNSLPHVPHQGPFCGLSLAPTMTSPACAVKAAASASNRVMPILMAHLRG